METEIKDIRQKYLRDFCDSATFDEREQVNLANHKIFAHNQQAPSWHFCLVPLIAHSELATVLPGSANENVNSERD